MTYFMASALEKGLQLASRILQASWLELIYDPLRIYSLWAGSFLVFGVHRLHPAHFFICSFLERCTPGVHRVTPF